MRYLILILLLVSGCSSYRVKVKNCIALDFNLYECDLVNEHTQGKGI